MKPDVYDLFRRSVIWDNHGCMPLTQDDAFLPQLERYLRAGVTVVSLNIGFGDMSWDEHRLTLDAMRRWINQRPESYRLISSVEDVHQCKSDNVLGITFDVEGMSPLAADFNRVEWLYKHGVRWILVAYNRNNAAGGGCLDQDGGLTELGRRIIDEMGRVGMVLCVSHTGRRTAKEAIEHARRPVILSHCNPYGHTPHQRNADDALLRAVADSGGVVGLSGIGDFLGGHEDVDNRFLSQLRYCIDLIGPAHVGLGLDYVFDVSELEHLVRANPQLFAAGTQLGSGRCSVAPEAILKIAEALSSANLADGDIQAVLGGNWLRVASEVWQ